MPCGELEAPLPLFLASFPKSGTTWLQAIVYHLLALNNEKLKAARPGGLSHISHYTPFLEVDSTWSGVGTGKDGCVREDIQANHRLLGRRVFNTHLLPSMLGCGASSAGAQCIYVVRRAKDACYSFYHHLSNQDEASGGGSYANFQEFAALWLEGKIVYGRWEQHLLAWFKAVPAMQDRVLILQYEDLVLDLPSQLKRVATFLALPALADSEIQALVGALEFSGMKASSSKYSPISVSWKDPANAFLRKGQVGDSLSAWAEGGPTLQQLYEDLLVSDVRSACQARPKSGKDETEAEEALSESAIQLLLSLI
jgi:hypothetical protein